MAEVAHLFICPGHRKPMQEFDEVWALLHRGMEGCTHARPQSSRQVLLVDTETLENLGLEPGVIKENVTVTGMNVSVLEPGVQIRLGEAEFRVTGGCEPCFRMDEIRPGLQRALDGRRGIICRVIKEGRIVRGDRVELVPAAAAQN